MYNEKKECDKVTANIHYKVPGVYNPHYRGRACNPNVQIVVCIMQYL